MNHTANELILRKAQIADASFIWNILQDAIEQRRLEGSTQWQDGYPNKLSILNDIEKGYGYVLTEKDLILSYAAIIFEKEPAYDLIEGKWLSNDEYVVVHRVAVSKLEKRKGIATKLFEKIEELSIHKKTFSIRVDTNFDNVPMLKILNNLNYTYCGEVYFRASARKAFEKKIS